jgi:hypothetical protein
MELNERERKHAIRMVERHDRGKNVSKWFRWVVLLFVFTTLFGYVFSSYKFDNVRQSLIEKYADVAVEDYKHCVRKETVLERLRLETSSYKWLGLKLHSYVFFVLSFVALIFFWRIHYIEPIKIKIYRHILENKKSAEQTLPQDTSPAGSADE